MNNPEYILVDVFADVAAAIKDELTLPVLNFQYGYIYELNETLLQMAKTQPMDATRFPLLYLVQPFTVQRGNPDELFGSTSDLRLLILNLTKKDWKASERMTNNFKPVIYPIYRSLLKQIANSGVFVTSGANSIPHRFTDRYYWGESQQNVLNDVVDCVDISNIALKIYNNQNCTPFKNF